MRRIRYKILAEKHVGDFIVQLLEHNYVSTADYYVVRKISDESNSDIYFGTDRWKAIDMYNLTK